MDCEFCCDVCGKIEGEYTLTYYRCVGNMCPGCASDFDEAFEIYGGDYESFVFAWLDCCMCEGGYAKDD